MPKTYEAGASYHKGERRRSMALLALLHRTTVDDVSKRITAAEVVTTPSERQATSRKSRQKAGGKAVSVVLSPDAAAALAKLLESRYADSQKEAIERALIAAARYA